MTPVPTYRLSPRARLEPDDDGVTGLVLDTRKATVFGCNETLWAILSELRDRPGQDVTAMASHLGTRFDVTRDVAEGDVSAVFGKLRSLELIDEF